MMYIGGADDRDPEVVLAVLLEEIEQLLKAGRPIDLTKYRASHPEHFEELCRLVPALKELNDAEL
jgi:hypothetical protein